MRTFFTKLDTYDTVAFLDILRLTEAQLITKSLVDAGVSHLELNTLRKICSL
ncbi:MULTISPECIES: hypothetical protein [unclassified Mesotoga]|uniref:hypothetical protein n=1 Tax=unclassified Mesotoga TaxID=1184398 RepID=UPI0015E8A24B|nr:MULTISPECIES: hypothetical protein [unclassified Mesotoga]